MYNERIALIKLINKTNCMDLDEKEFWRDIMPSMNNKHIEELTKVLLEEKELIDELDIKYNKKVRELNEKHLTNWKQNFNN